MQVPFELLIGRDWGLGLNELYGGRGDSSGVLPNIELHGKNSKGNRGRVKGALTMPRGLAFDRRPPNLRLRLRQKQTQIRDKDV